MDSDELQTSLREQKIQNHRLESQVGELEIRITHHLEDLSKARAERDQFEEKFKDASGRLAAVGEELKQVRGKYEALKLLFVPQMPPAELKRKREGELEQEVRQLAPAFREHHPNPERHQVNRGSPSHQYPSFQGQYWSSPTASSQFLSPRHDTTPMPTTPQRPSMLSHLSSGSESTSTASAETSPHTSPIPGLQTSLRAIGVHSTPWSQHGNSYLLQSSSPMSSTRLSTTTTTTTPTSASATMPDSLRTTDPRRRSKVDESLQTTPTRSTMSIEQNARATPTTTTTTTHITQQISTVQQQQQQMQMQSPPKRPRGGHGGVPLPTKPPPPVHEGPRLPSEVRKRTISLTAKPIRSSPRHLGSRRQESGELERKVKGAESSSGDSDESDSG